MSMTVLLNERVYFPANDNKGLMIEVSSLHHEVKCPKVDVHNVCSISVRLGTFYGYDLATYLDLHTGGEFNGTEWLFGIDDAKNLIENIKDELDNPSDPNSTEHVEDIRESLAEIRDLLTKALENGADCFEVFLW